MKCAIIGFGYWGKIIKKYIDESDFFELCDIYSKDKNSENLDSFLNKTQAEAIFICTPVSTHYEVTYKCLTYNKHVFCEKPFVLDEEKTNYLFKLADEKKLKIFVDYIYLFSNSIIKIREILTESSNIERINIEMAQFGKFYDDVGVIESIGVHMLSVLCSLYNYSDMEIINIYGVKTFKKQIVELNICIKCKNIEVNIFLSLISAVKKRIINVFAKEFSLCFDMMSKETVSYLKFSNDISDSMLSTYSFDETNNLKNVIIAFENQIKQNVFINKNIVINTEKLATDIKRKI